MVGSIDNAHYRNTKLDASDGNRCEGSFSVVCNVSKPSPSSIKEEGKVGGNVCQNCRTLVLLNLRWSERGKVHFRTRVWGAGNHVCFVDVANGRWRKYPFSWRWWESLAYEVVCRCCLELLDI